MGDTLPCVATLRHADAGNRACDEQGMTVSTSTAVMHATHQADLPELPKLAYAATPATRHTTRKAVEGTPAAMEGLGA